MGLVSNVISTAMKTPDKPIFSPDTCLNRKQHKFVCTLCHDLCPGQVFSLKSKEPLKWDQCTNCGLCVSVCPSRCFAPDASAQKIYTEEMDFNSPITFACFQEKEACQKRVNCLASIPWELIALLALYTDVVLYVGGCSLCKMKQGAACLQTNLNHCKEFLGEEQYRSRIHLLKQGRFERPGEEAAVMSRREIFAGMKASLVKNLSRAALSSLTFIDSSEKSGLQYRQLLSSVVTKIREDRKEEIQAYEVLVEGEKRNRKKPELPAFGVSLPAFLKSCYGCGVCERICPQKAIEIGPEENGKRMIYMTPWKCTGCTLCVHTCPYGGLKGMHTVQVPHLEKIALVRVDTASCQMCGVAISPKSGKQYCPSCDIKVKKKVR